MKVKLICIVANSLIMALPLTVTAHGGDLDGSGCHTNRKTGEYHCHRGGYTAPAATPRTIPQSNTRSYTPTMPTYPSVDSTCYTGPRGGRYRIVNGKKRYGC